jgi:hypothetical protein
VFRRVSRAPLLVGLPFWLPGARSTTETTSPNPSIAEPLKLMPGDVLEIYGASVTQPSASERVVWDWNSFRKHLLFSSELRLGRAGTGKTEMIYQAILAVALPDSFDAVQLAGSGAFVRSFLLQV